MNSFWKTVLINIGAIVALALLIGLSNGRDAAMVFGLVAIIIAFVEFGLGLILLIPEHTRKYSKIMLAAAGIVFLIGASVCSIFPSHMNFR
jgi:hypothetical protein